MPVSVMLPLPLAEKLPESVTDAVALPLWQLVVEPVAVPEAQRVPEAEPEAVTVRVLVTEMVAEAQKELDIVPQGDTAPEPEKDRLPVMEPVRVPETVREEVPAGLPEAEPQPESELEAVREPSLAVTLTLTLASEAPGVPLKVRVLGVNVSHEGNAVPSALVAV